MSGESERIVIDLLDGGLGTSLEATLGQDVLGHSLWSTNAVINHPSTLVRTHVEFLRAGSRVVETATYQASIRGLVASGLSSDDASQVMLQAVRLAQEALDAFEVPPLRSSDGKASIALSLGPFGATLSPTQEFEGHYPPPYGPRGCQESKEGNIRNFHSSEEEEAAVDALAQFHLERLLLYSSDPTVWEAVEHIAFETILLPREVTAIRKAMRLFERDLFSRGKSLTQQWWISFVCPDLNNPGLGILTEAALSPSERPIPTGIGINCTSVDDIGPLALSLTQEATKHGKLQDLTLVLYPNGGKYDTATQRWLPLSDDAALQWATRFASILHEQTGWKKIMAGGCCCTDYSFINQLSRQIRK
ncbi:homocysteine S-methyltransferase [Coprinopsis sp. MPI-PUGE-AT-0042]|nr:homocysteine S-methyltransferase [Coprinopsis sp. MPI-PUGE-AT-0042]